MFTAQQFQRDMEGLTLGLQSRHLPFQPVGIQFHNFQIVVACHRFGVILPHPVLGAETAHELLFRADAHHHLTRPDLERVDDLKIFNHPFFVRHFRHLSRSSRGLRFFCLAFSRCSFT